MWDPNHDISCFPRATSCSNPLKLKYNQKEKRAGLLKEDNRGEQSKGKSRGGSRDILDKNKNNSNKGK